MKNLVSTHPLPLLEDPPDVELLQWLARGSLKQNLQRSVRLWVWLCSLYGDENERLNLSEPFTYKDWRDAFFGDTHPKGEASPDRHDPTCACAKTMAQWLFTPKTGLVAALWQQEIQQHSAIAEEVLEEWLNARLFAVTRRSLAADLEILAEQGWLKAEINGYYRVEALPRRPGQREMEWTSYALGGYDLGFLNAHLESIAQSLSQPVAEVQRFFLEVDYIVVQTQNRVETWLEQLKAIWEQPGVVPICLSYASARHGLVCCIVYPVCVYYVQRAVYLCGFGQTPTGQGEWYNYRVDKIQAIDCLKWTDPSLPKVLQKRRKTLPTPDYIRNEMANAWGFDFYLPARLMLLRFNRTFHDRYIKGTFRHKTFKPVSYQQAQQLIQDHKTATQSRSLLQRLQHHCQEDAYYTVVYRTGDTNVGLRLRAWRPNVEVLLPWELRQDMAREVQAEWQFYQE